MILAPHAIIGTAFARIITVNPISGFCFGFLSHFLADMVPHWEYNISKAIHPDTSSKIILNRELFLDILKIGTDFVVGILFSLWLFYDENIYFLLASSVGGIFPDFLQFLYGKIKNKPLILFKKFHDIIHAKKLENRTIFGVLSQIFVTMFFIFVSYFLSPL